MNKRIMVLLTLVFVSGQMFAAKGLTFNNRMKVDVYAQIDKGTDKGDAEGWVKVPAGKSTFLATAEYGDRGAYIKVGDIVYKTKKYPHPEYIDAFDGGKYDMHQVGIFKKDMGQKAESIDMAQVKKEKAIAAEQTSILTLVQNISIPKAIGLITKAPGLVKDIIKLVGDADLKKAIDSITKQAEELTKIAADITTAKGQLTPEEGMKLSINSIEKLIELANGLNAIAMKIREVTDTAADNVVGVFNPGKDTENLKKLVNTIKSISDTINLTLKNAGPKVIETLKKIQADEAKKNDLKAPDIKEFEKYQADKKKDAAKKDDKELKAPDIKELKLSGEAAKKQAPAITSKEGRPSAADTKKTIASKS